ncbi:MAG TPA: hypothetical protein VH092_30135, partial [Urbifossiella sp.]|nr:hypothetical protein [Urbifossiella sp.]
MPDTRRPRVELLEDRLAPAAAGSFDPTFGTNGVVNITSGGVYRLASTPDGDFLALSGTPRFVSGLTQPGFSGPFSLALFGPNGMPDPAFGTGGAVTIPGSTGVPILTALPDGGALVGWNEPDAARGTTDFDLARVTAAGAIDTTFGSGGTAVVPTPGGSSTADLAAVVLQPDGQILLGGDQIQALNDGSGQTPAGQLLVVRVSAAGQPDPTFGAGGTAVVPFPVGSSNYATGGGLAVQPDGRIVLAGSALVSAQTQSTPVAVRLTAAGQPDPTFGSGGRVQVTFPQQYTGNFQTVGIQADGRVVLAGLVVTNPTSTGFPLPAADGAARLTADGQLDPTYGTGGVSVGGEITTVLDSGTNGVILNAAIDSSGRVVFDAAIYNDIRIRGFVDSATVSRLTADGATDGGFGTNGTVTFDSLGRTTPPLIWMPGLTLQSNGNILLSGTAQEAGPFRMVQLIGSNPPSGFVAATTGTLVAGGPADGTIQVLNPTSGTYSLAGTVTAFPGFAGNVRVATADVNGDGIPDYIFG